MQTDLPLVTTIIPTYRRPKLLRRAIRSVLNQTYPHFQVCVYDNASGDETADVVNELAKKDSRVKYYCHQENIGSLANYNYGIERVATPFFSLLSDDDVVLPNFFRKTLEGFERFPDAIFSAGSGIAMTDQGQVLGAPLSLWKRVGYYSPPGGLLEMIGGKHPLMSGILFRKQVIDVFGGMDLEIVAADLDLEIRIAARFPFVVSQEPCSIFVYHTLSAGVQAGSSWIWPSCLKTIRNLREDNSLSPSMQDEVERCLTAFFTKTIFTIGVRSAIRSNFADAHSAVEALRTHYRLYTKAFILASITWILEHVQPANRLALRSYNSLALIRRITNRGLQRKYGHLSSFLEIQ